MKPNYFFFFEPEDPPRLPPDLDPPLLPVFLDPVRRVPPEGPRSSSWTSTSRSSSRRGSRSRSNMFSSVGCSFRRVHAVWWCASRVVRLRGWQLPCHDFLRRTRDRITRSFARAGVDEAGG